MNNFKPIDYKKNQEITKQLEKFILEKLQSLLGQKDLKDHMDFFKIVTSTKYGGNWEKIEKELKEIFEEEDQKVIEEIIKFIKTDLNPKFDEISKKFEAAVIPKIPKVEIKKDEGQLLKKREKPEEIKKEKIQPRRRGILDRIKPRQKPQKTPVQGSTIGKTEKKEGEVQPNLENGERKKKDPAKVRCRFWPVCKDTECLFAHPKDQVF